MLLDTLNEWETWMFGVAERRVEVFEVSVGELKIK